jgi:hypothetical protein
MFRLAVGITAFPSAVPDTANATGFVKLVFVPEPGTGLLVLAGLLGLGGIRRGRQIFRSRPCQ